MRRRPSTVLVALAGLAAVGTLAVGTARLTHQPERDQSGGSQVGGRQPESAQPGVDLGKAEAPDGTMHPVLSRKQIVLVVEDLKIGTGEAAEATSTVEVHYHGTFKDGKVFDTTRGDRPARFPLNRLIPAWQIGIKGMKVGGVRRLIVPPEMGYGDVDRLNPETGEVSIPANSVLYFSIELVSVTKPAGGRGG